MEEGIETQASSEAIAKLDFSLCFPWALRPLRNFALRHTHVRHVSPLRPGPALPRSHAMGCRKAKQAITSIYSSQQYRYNQGLGLHMHSVH